MSTWVLLMTHKMREIIVIDGRRLVANTRKLYSATTESLDRITENGKYTGVQDNGEERTQNVLRGKPKWEKPRQSTDCKLSL